VKKFSQTAAEKYYSAFIGKYGNIKKRRAQMEY
jgi:hypothetical protein